MRKFTIRDLCLAAMVAALYAVMSYFAELFGVAYGPIQFRFSEALCVLPFFFPYTAPGLFVGCLISNLLSPYGLMDIVGGSLATLLAALWTCRARHKWFAPLPPVICNTVIVGFVISWAEIGGFGDAFFAAWAYNGLTVGLGELAVCYVLGGILLAVLPRIGFFKAMIPPGKLPAEK